MKGLFEDCRLEGITSVLHEEERWLRHTTTTPRRFAGWRERPEQEGVRS